ncbi:hypothetical protein B484DRAFT_399297 [Ochromonadaceae sp. CCMP2298]|nr:hypothetical protein B484DRAFT_399297 [Ochromonadaceae sp. CCMP2298]
MSKRTRASSASPGRKEQKSQIQLQQDADAEVQGAEVVSPMKKFPQFPLTLGSPLKRLTPNGGAGGAVGGAGVKGAGAGGAGGAGGGGTVSDGRFDLVVGHLLQTFKTLDTVLLTFQRHQKTSTWGAVVDAYQAISPRALLLEDLLHLLDIWGDAYDTRWMPKNHDHEQKPRNFELIVELPNRNDDSTAIAAVTAATVTAATVAAAATATSPGYRLDFTAGAGTTSTNNNSSTTTIATTTSTVAH